MIGAIVIRIIATVFVVYLLQIPYLMLIGGLVLIYIAIKLLTEDNEQHDIKASSSLFSAIRTIIVADAAMGLDNVIAIGGASGGNITLVVIGLLISIPVIIWGSTLFLKLIDRYPIIIYIGSGILALTAAKMITEEEKLAGIFNESWIKWLVIGICLVTVLLTGKIVNSKKSSVPTQS